jgi:hypothetical protein
MACEVQQIARAIQIAGSPAVPDPAQGPCPAEAAAVTASRIGRWLMIACFDRWSLIRLHFLGVTPIATFTDTKVPNRPPRLGEASWSYSGLRGLPLVRTNRVVGDSNGIVPRLRDGVRTDMLRTGSTCLRQ